MIYEPWTKPFYEYCETLRIDGFRRALKQNKRLVFTFCYVAPDDDEFVAKIMRLTEEYNKKILFVRLVADPKTVLERVENNDRKQFSKISNREVLTEYLNNSNCCSLIESSRTLEINSTISLPEDSAKRIVEVLTGK